MEGSAGDGERAASRELLSVGCGAGLHEKLLINSKQGRRKDTTLPIVKIQEAVMAQANEELAKEMTAKPASHFDIETVEDTLDSFIEMNVAVIELNESDTSSDEESSSEDSSQSDSDVCITDEVMQNNIRLPKQNGKGGKIEILESEKD